MGRLLALIIILIPGVLSVIGVKLIRDSLFKIIHWPFFQIWQQISVGFLFFLTGLAIIGGFIYHRDKKRNKITKRRFSR
ncbi:DUF2627 domain-containing protein [Bacillus andreraoultii]|uniref:DUF2627 domain-containing protein n=1 Tax=Bacillus andreraoultii TaxID=1499685 RepID=UPI00053A9AF8|nr:DUF2627 domain-containing protein [Bacillus andreraoultii]